MTFRDLVEAKKQERIHGRDEPFAPFILNIAEAKELVDDLRETGNLCFVVKANGGRVGRLTLDGPVVDEKVEPMDLDGVKLAGWTLRVKESK